MWKELTSAAFAVVAMLVSVEECTGFSNTALTATTRGINSLSVLDASNNEDENEPKEKGFFANFFDELDAFVDDATSRRLGAGAQYYGKRKSGFYGKDDSNRKMDKGVSDPTGEFYLKSVQQANPNINVNLFPSEFYPTQQIRGLPWAK